MASSAGERAAAIPRTSIPAGYTGTPFGDSRHPKEPQRVPGRLQCELYERDSTTIEEGEAP